MKRNIFTLVAFFFLGAITGATVALLNAPQSGKKTRLQLRNEIADARYRTNKAIRGVQERALDQFDEIQDHVKDVSNEALQHTESVKSAFQQVAAMPKAILEKRK